MALGQIHFISSSVIRCSCYLRLQLRVDVDPSHHALEFSVLSGILPLGHVFIFDYPAVCPLWASKNRGPLNVPLAPPSPNACVPVTSLSLLKGALRSSSSASLQIISHDTRRFRFALPSAQHILGLPIGESA